MGVYGQGKCTYNVFALNIDFVVWSKIKALEN